MSTNPPADTRSRRSARERVLLVLDADSFVETEGAGASTSTITGHGTIEGRPVCAYATGTPTSVEADRITRLIELATRTGRPVVGMDEGGASSESLAALAAIGRMHRAMTRASGVVPQVTIISGPVERSQALTAALADVVVLAGDEGGLQLSSADALATAGSLPDDRSRREGAHHLADDIDAAGAWVRTLIGFLPPNNLADPPIAEPVENDSSREDLDDLGVTASHRPYEVQQVIASVLDGGDFCELQPHQATNLVCGFGRLAGRSVGVVANQRAHLGGVLDQAAATKAARFVRTCDAFNIAVITFVDSPGFLAEQGFQAVRGPAALVHAYAEASVPLLSVIIGPAYGTAYEVMASRAVGADLVLAWPSASIAAAPPQEMVNRLHGAELAGAADPETRRAELIKERAAADVDSTDTLGLLDAVVPPHRTRDALVQALRLLESKRDQQPPRRHGNIPL